MNSQMPSQAKQPFDLSSFLFTARDRRSIRGLGTGVSRNNIGLVTFESLAIESDVILIIKEKGITLKVKSCEPDRKKEGVFHVVIATNDPMINLMNLLEGAATFVKSNESSVRPAPTSAEKVAPKFTFEKLRPLLTNARTADPNILRHNQLTKLADQYRAYPINDQGISFAVLLPKDMKPADAVAFDDNTAAARKIFIIKFDQNNITLVWPLNPKPEASSEHNLVK